MNVRFRNWVDTVALRLFGRHLEDTRHSQDRTHFRGLAPGFPYETFLIRQYVLSWIVALSIGGVTGIFARRVFSGLPPRSIPRPELVPGVETSSWITCLGICVGLVGFGLSKYLFRRLVSLALGYLVRRRRSRIRETLPGAVRYLHVAATGTAALEQLFERVASKTRIHGATATRFEDIARRQSLTGSLETAIRQAARDTPARETLAPFLLSVIEHSRNGEDQLREFLAEESRLLAIEDERRHRRSGAYLRRVLVLFVLLLVGPVVVGLTVAGTSIVYPNLFPGTAGIPAWRVDGVVTVLGIGVILLFGGGAALFAFLLRPSNHRWATPAPSQSFWGVLGATTTNPTNTLFVLIPVSLCVLGWKIATGSGAGPGLLVAYLTVAIPTGLVDVRRARRRTRLDRALPSFVHDLSERLEAGLPFRSAVAGIAREESYGTLDEPIRKLAADLQLIHGPDGGRKRALERFVGRIGTPFAGRTLGLAIGALESGGDARSAVAHLRMETGRLAHADTARRTRFPAMILVGWSVAMLIIAIVVVVNLMVLETATPTGPVAGIAVETFEQSSRERPLFYALTQSTMLASGWFAGLTGRGVYEALLHSGVLLALTWAGFRLAGLV